MLSCGAGRDTAVADTKDTVAKDCEVVKGLPTSPPPPPPPPAPTIRAGAYARTTSQGKTVGFDVLGDLSGVTNPQFVVDLTCQEVPIVPQNLRIPLTGTAAIGAERSFGTTFSGGDADGSISGAFRGSFDGSGNASGILRVDMAVNTPGGTVHCSSGDVTWNAK